MKDDLRVIKTKNTIRGTFVDMIEEIGYQKITIKDLCERALINRNTFYLHYADKDDLVRSLMNETMEKIREFLGPFAVEVMLYINTGNVEGFAQKNEELLNLLLEDIELYRIVLIDEILNRYFKGIEDLIEKNILAQLHPKNHEALVSIKYIFNGAFGILSDWIVKDTGTVKETSYIMAQLIYDNVQFYNKVNHRQ